MTLLEPTIEPPHIREPPTPRVSMICVVVVVRIRRTRILIIRKMAII